MMQEKIIIIDGNSLINRAFYGLPPLTTKDGIYTNAVYGFVNMLYKIYEDYRPQYISVAFDRKAPTFRHVEYEAYKAGRKRMPEELGQQLPILKELLDVMNIHRMEIDGFEADDLIGTLVRYCEEKNLESLVVTGDRDALQLASDKTRILITKKGMTDLEIYTPDSIIERYEVTPSQFIDLKGLMGDPSDNIPGVPGVGEKTAIKLLKQFGSIEKMIQNTKEIQNQKLREKIESNIEQAIFSKRLATIKTDVPIELSLEALKRESPNQEKLMEVFRRLEFHSFIQKMKTNEETTELDTDMTKIQTIENLEDVSDMAEAIERAAHCYIKIFGTGENVRNRKIVGISILIDDGHSYYLEFEKIGQSLDVLKAIFENENILKSGHNIKNEILLLQKYGISLTGVDFDTSIAVYLLEPTRTSYEIHEIYNTYLGKNMNSEETLIGKGKNRITFLDIDRDMLVKYGHQVCTAVKELKKILAVELENLELKKLFQEVEIPLIKVLADMEYEGFRVDHQMLSSLGKELNGKIEQLVSEIYDMAGEQFNINSTKQLGDILFEKLKLPAIKKTKTGYSTNIEVLEKLSKKHPIIAKIIEYRQYVKLKSTYIDGLIDVINEKTKKIHSSFNQTVTATGRISSTEPNLQNIPIRLELGREIRKVFIPTDDNYLLLDADYSQIELRVLAHISQDPGLMEAFEKEQDVHTMTASKVFDVPFDQVTSQQRSSAKAVNFGIVYGISDFGLAENLGITKKEAQKYIDEYFDKYRGVKSYMNQAVEEGKKNGYVTTILNRRRYIPELLSSNYNIRSFGERTAMNTPIQGSAADIIKVAMLRVYDELKRRNLRSKLILQVHDELIVEIHQEEIEEVKQIVKKEMEEAIQLTVPLKVDIHLGKSWYDTK
ncbi:DNA polymerase I [Geosporobacter ferrireducens]|nr:DNA polymerase I [Geosporobacter ferrireducens]